MVVVYDGPFLLVVTSDHVSSLLLPSSRDLLKLVGVDPGADDVFVLSLVFPYYLDKDFIRQDRDSLIVTLSLVVIRSSR